MAVEDRWRLADGETPSARDGIGMRYRVRWYEHGVRRARSFAGRRAAERWWHQVNVDREQPSPTVSAVTVAELTELWLATKDGLSDKGWEACEIASRHVDAVWGPRLASDVRPSEVAVWAAGLGHSTSWRRKVLQCLHGALQLAVDDGDLTENPAAGVTVGPEQAREGRALTSAELAALATAAGPHPRDDHDYLQVKRRPEGAPPKRIGRYGRQVIGTEQDTVIIWLLGTTGIRIGEAAALDVGDVTRARRRLRVRRSKNGEARDVPIATSVLAMLDLDRPPGAPLLVGPRGSRINIDNWRVRTFRPAAERAGLGDLHPHDLRHTAVSLAIAAGADVKVVQRMVGHKTAKMTLDRYGHLWDGALDLVAERLDAVVQASDSGTGTGTHEQPFDSTDPRNGADLGPGGTGDDA